MIETDRFNRSGIDQETSSTSPCASPVLPSTHGKENASQLVIRNKRTKYIQERPVSSGPVQKRSHVASKELALYKLRENLLNSRDDVSGMSRIAKGVTFSLWAFLPQSSTSYYTTVLPEDYDPDTRFSTSEDTPNQVEREYLWLRGAVWEVRQHYLTGPHIELQDWEEIKKGMRSLTSNLHTTLRKCAPQILQGIPGPTSDDLHNLCQNDARVDNPRLLKLLDYNANTDDPYPKFCSVINSSDSDPLEAVFRSPTIPRVIVFVLFGSRRISKKAPHPYNNKCYATAWNATEVTPGMIAFAAVAVRWMISNDDTFRPVGNRTNIDWMDAYVSYKRLLVHNSEDPSIKALFASINQAVFSEKPLHPHEFTPVTAFGRVEQAFAARRASILADTPPSMVEQRGPQSIDDGMLAETNDTCVKIQKELSVESRVETNNPREAETADTLESMSKEQLFTFFEPILRQNFALLKPVRDLEKLVKGYRTTMEREELIELVRGLSGTMSDLGDWQVPIKTEQSTLGPEMDQSAEGSSNGLHIGSQIESKVTKPRLDETILNGIYILGTGKAFVTTSREFEIPEDKFARAVAWTKKIEPLQEHISYHFKVVLSADIQRVFSTLHQAGVVEPEVLDEDEDTTHEFEEAVELYHRTLAQAIYCPPSIWLPEKDFCMIMNVSRNIELSQIIGTQPFTFIDATGLVVMGTNQIQLIEMKNDLQKYAFCLFEKRPNPVKIQQTSV